MTKFFLLNKFVCDLVIVIVIMIVLVMVVIVTVVIVTVIIVTVERATEVIVTVVIVTVVIPVGNKREAWDLLPRHFQNLGTFTGTFRALVLHVEYFIT